MSEYTIVNILSGKYPLEDFKSTLDIGTHSRFVRLRNKSVLARWGGDKRNSIKEKMIGSDSGKLIYETPIDLGVSETGEAIAYIVINYFEDTGNHHESELFRIKAFDKAEKIDEIRIEEDRRGEKVDKYYKQNYSLETSINPP